MRALLAAEVALSHELDPTRPAAIGGTQSGAIDMIGDVAGYNGDGARLFLHPKVASAVTEYGSAKEIRPGASGLLVTIALPVGTRTSGLWIVLESVSQGALPGLAEVAVRGARAKERGHGWFD